MQVRMIYQNMDQNYEFLKSKLNEDSLIERFNLILDEKMNDLVSVIMSTYNSEATVSVAIESILEQSYSNVELLIVDDASNDNTVKIIEEYCKISKNIKLLKIKKMLD